MILRLDGAGGRARQGLISSEAELGIPSKWLYASTEETTLPGFIWGSFFWSVLLPLDPELSHNYQGMPPALLCALRGTIAKLNGESR